MSINGRAAFAAFEVEDIPLHSGRPPDVLNSPGLASLGDEIMLLEGGASGLEAMLFGESDVYDDSGNEEYDDQNDGESGGSAEDTGITLDPGDLAQRETALAKVVHKRRLVIAQAGAERSVLESRVRKLDVIIPGIVRDAKRARAAGDFQKASGLDAQVQKYTLIRGMAASKAVRFAKVQALGVVLTQQAKLQQNLLVATRAALAKGQPKGARVLVGAFNQVAASTKGLKDLRKAQVVKSSAQTAAAKVVLASKLAAQAKSRLAMLVRNHRTASGKKQASIALKISQHQALVTKLTNVAREQRTVFVGQAGRFNAMGKSKMTTSNPSEAMRGLSSFELGHAMGELTQPSFGSFEAEPIRTDNRKRADGTVAGRLINDFSNQKKYEGPATLSGSALAKFNKEAAKNSKVRTGVDYFSVPAPVEGNSTRFLRIHYNVATKMIKINAFRKGGVVESIGKGVSDAAGAVKDAVETAGRAAKNLLKNVACKIGSNPGVLSAAGAAIGGPVGGKADMVAGVLTNACPSKPEAPVDPFSASSSDEDGKKKSLALPIAVGGAGLLTILLVAL